MIRIIGGIILLIAAVLWLPIWLQLILFAVAIIIVPYRFFIIIPAIIGDALYAPTTHISLTAHWLTLIVLAMLALHWFIMRKMRIDVFYGLEA